MKDYLQAIMRNNPAMLQLNMYLQRVLPEEVQGMSKHLDGPHPSTVDRLQLRLHGEVLQQTQSHCFNNSIIFTFISRAKSLEQHAQHPTLPPTLFDDLHCLMCHSFTDEEN